jgi:hypothetical protein
MRKTNAEHRLCQSLADQLSFRGPVPENGLSECGNLKAGQASFSIPRNILMCAGRVERRGSPFIRRKNGALGGLGQSNQTRGEHDRELRISDQVAFQNRLFDSVVRSINPHIRRRGFVRTYRRKLQIVWHTFEPTLCATNSAMQLQDAIYLVSFFFIGGFFSAPLVLINDK